MRANRFDFLRLVFASAVFAYHLVTLAALDVSGVWEPRLAQLAEISIQGFFVISGALVYGSWERSKSVADYAGKRIRRLYPAYFVVILVPAAVALLLGGALEGIAHYIGANLLFANFFAPTLPGLFDNQRFNEVNGALWTLKIEVMFYILLLVLGPLIVWLKRRSPRVLIYTLIFTYLAGEAWRFGFQVLGAETGQSIWFQIARQLPGQMAFFCSGIALWIWRDQITERLPAVWRLGLLLFAVSIMVPGGELGRAVGLAALIAGLAWGRGPDLPAARYGDISYGLYICHFPIVQALVAVGAFVVNPWLAAALAVVLTIGTSFALWHLVERPALRPDSHYRQT